PPAVLAAEAVETHIPEAAFRLRPASEGGLTAPPAGRARFPPTCPVQQVVSSTFLPLPGDRPTVLFEAPEPAEVTLLQPEGPVIGLQWHRLHRIRTAIGPERIG